MEELLSKHGYECEIKDFSSHKNKLNVIIKVEPISFQYYPNSGYIVRIKKVRDSIKDTNEKSQQLSVINDTHDIIEESISQQCTQTQTSNNNFGISKILINRQQKTITQYLGIKYDPHNIKYIGNIEEGVPICNKYQFINQPQTGYILGNLKVTADDNKERVANQFFKDYSEGIRTKRLYLEGKVDDIQDEEEEQEDLDTNKHEKNEQNVNQVNYSVDCEDDGTLNITSILNNRKNFVDFIYSSKFLYSNALAKYKLVVFMFAILIAGFIFINYFFIAYQMQNIILKFAMIQNSNNLINEEQQILSLIQILNHNPKDEEYKQQLRATQLSFEDIASFLNQNESKVELSKQHKKILKEKIIPMHSKQGDSIKTTKEQLQIATNVIIGMIKEVLDNNEFDKNNREFFYININTFNQYHFYLVTNSELYLEELQEWLQNRSIYYWYLYGILITFWAVFFVISVVSQYFFSKSQSEVLQCFTNIPKNQVKYLQQHTEEFLQQIQGDAEADFKSDLDNNYEDEEDQLMQQSKRRQQSRKQRTKMESSSKMQMIFYLPIFMFFVIVNLFFFSSFYMQYTFNSRMHDISLEYFAISKIQHNFQLFYNGLVQILIDESIKIDNIDPYLFIEQNQYKLFQINNLIQQQHTQNHDIHNGGYNYKFEQIMGGDNCDQYTQDNILENCSTFNNGILAEGLYLLNSKQIENIKEIFYDIQKIKNGNLTEKQVEEEKMKLLDTDLLKNTRQIQLVYLKKIQEYLIQEFQKFITQDHELNRTIKISILIVAIVVLIIFVFFIWYPSLGQIYKKIVRVRSMVLMIPIEICLQVSEIKKMLQEYQQKQYNY